MTKPAARDPEGRPEGIRVRGRLLRAALVSVLALAGLGCFRAQDEEDRAGRPDVVLIVLDTVRADHLGCYGYDRAVSPALDRFAETATRFTGARATSPWTLPSHASMFTGLYPFEHGAHTVWMDLPDTPWDPSSGPLVDNARPLPRHRDTLAEVLREAGYRTGAIGANWIYLDPRYGLARGFDTYDMRHEYADAVNRRAREWLAQRDGRPVFLFLNYMDAHIPYHPEPVPRLFDRRVPSNSREVMRRLYPRVLPRKKPLPRDSLGILRDQYDRGIANLDAGLGRLFGHLAELGMYSGALVIVTSDHGEYLGEHGLVSHSKDVYEPALHIPLLVKEPGQTSGRVRRDPVSLVHLPHIVLSRVAGADRSPFPYRRSSDAFVLAENYFSRMKDLVPSWGRRFRRIRRVLYQGQMKYIASSDGRNELYDLASDPGERNNLVDARPKTTERLARALERRMVGRRLDVPEMDRRKPTPDERKRLETLGYL